MGKIVFLMGKSACGKDTIFGELKKDRRFGFEEIVLGTTRPIRAGEIEGKSYHFKTEEEFQVYLKEHKIIEHRAYETMHGTWRYFMINEDTIDITNKNYLLIGTLESYQQVREFFGKDTVIPVLIDLEDGLRLERALHREQQQENPKYEELCRRFLADQIDFDKEKIQSLEIDRSFYNIEIEECLEEIVEYLTCMKIS